MIPRFVSCRPRFTAGTLVPGFPEVQKVLYCDGAFEAYQLARRRDTSLLLVGVRSPADKGAPTEDCLRTWITGSGGEKIVRAFPRVSIADEKAFDLVVEIRGSWMAEVPTLPLVQDELYALLMALIDLATMANENGLTAAVSRSLLWIAGPAHAPRLSSIYVQMTTGAESEVVREIAQTFLWAATGIASVETESIPDHDRLRSWCQNADASLSRVITQCLDPQSTATLSELRLEVNRCLYQLAEQGRLHDPFARRFVEIGAYRVAEFRRFTESR